MDILLHYIKKKMIHEIFPTIKFYSNFSNIYHIVYNILKYTNIKHILL